MLKKSFLFNLLLIAIICAGLLYAFFASLNYLTNHGKETKVPDLEGKNMPQALAILKKEGFKIQLDSTYRSYEKPLAILFQEPSAGSIVKVGRTVFLTINRSTPPSIPMPNLVNISFRNALLQMQSYRLVMGDTTYRPDVAAGAVLEQWYNGKPILPGQLIPLGSRVDLVVGEGLSDMQDVPNLIGMSWGEAKAYIESHNLVANPIFEGSISDTFGAIIFSQQPEALNELDFKNSIMSGDILDLRMMQNPGAELLRLNQPGSRKLLGEDSRMVDSNGNPIEETPYYETPATPTTKNDSNAPRKPRVPGVNVPNAAKDLPINPKQKNNSSLGDTKRANVDVNTLGGDKPKPKKPLKPKVNSGSSITPKPKTDSKPNLDKPKSAPVKKSDDNIKNEFE